MPFYIYEVEHKNTSSRMRQQRGASLAGKNGPYYAHVKDKIDGQDDFLTWEVTEEDVLRHHGIEDTKRHAFLIDLKPSSDDVSLYRLKRTWGYTKPSWTPIALQIEYLFADHEVDDADTFIEEFIVPDDSGTLVHEFLYLRGGLNGGGWNWGRVGSVNGALLNPEVFNYFAKQIASHTGLNLD